MLALITVLLATLVAANTEKAIILAPNNINIPSTHPNLDDLQVDTLTPDKWAIRTYLQAQFPTDSAKYGKPTWLVLDQLTEGQRYEVRVCWAATVSSLSTSIYKSDRTPSLTADSNPPHSSSIHMSCRPSLSLPSSPLSFPTTLWVVASSLRQPMKEAMMMARHPQAVLGNARRLFCSCRLSQLPTTTQLTRP